MSTPELVESTHEYRTGYGPRCLHLVLVDDGVVALVGCKDGTITAATVRPGGDRSEARPQGRTPCGHGVRSIAGHANDLIVADDGGCAYRLSLAELKERDRWHRLSAVAGVPATLACVLEPSEPRRVLVSNRDGTRVWRDAKDGDIEPIALGEPVPSGLMCCVPIKLNERSGFLLVEESAGLWWMAEPDLAITRLGGLRDLLAESGDTKHLRPTFVSDFSPVPGAHHRIYLSTNEGVFQVEVERTDGVVRATASPVALPETSGMVVAISARESGSDDASNVYLWAADTLGRARLFTRESGKPTERDPPWVLALISHGGPSVLRAELHVFPPAGGETSFAAVQACRSDRLRVSWFREAVAPTADRDHPDMPGAQGFDVWLGSAAVDELTKIKEEPGYNGVPEDLVVADFLEWAGEHKPTQVLDYLRRPKPGLFAQVLDRCHDDPGRLAALRVWTDTFLGVLHRMGGGANEEAYLGVLRWLASLSDYQRLVGEAVSRVRKWGVYGATYRERSGPLAVVLHTLRCQTEGLGLGDDSVAKLPARQPDALVYDARLMERRFDLELQVPVDERPGWTAWDVHVDDHGVQSEPMKHSWVAVSWSKGVELYVLRRVRYPEGGDWSWHLVPMKPGSGGKEPETKPESESKESETGPLGYSRAIVMGRLASGASYLLLAKRVRKPDPPGQQPGEVSELELKLLRSPPEVVAATESLPSDSYVHGVGQPVPLKQSVFSMIELAPGLVLAGLRGDGGIACVQTLRVSANSVEALTIEQLTPAAPSNQNDTTVRNPVWSLAIDRASVDEKSDHVVVAGCGDGQVFRLLVSADGTVTVSCVVGRLGSPVWAVACRGASEECPERVYAGTSDGTVQAWQRDARGEDLWTVLWATREGAAVGRIHLFDPTLGGEHRAVLAVTHGGRAVVFNDRGQAESGLGKKAEFLRLEVPGERYDRLDLGVPVLASDVLRRHARRERDKDFAWPSIIVATNAGVLRVVTPCWLRRSKPRREIYRRLQTTWEGLSFPCDQISGEQAVGDRWLRSSEAMRVAAPELSLAPLRWLLLPITNIMSFNRFALTRHLRLVYDIRAAIDSSADPKELRQLVVRALRVARTHGEPRLFEELVEALLLWVNKVTFSEDTSIKDYHSRLLAVMGGVEDSTGMWVGAKDGMDLHMRIRKAKALMNGSAFWKLSTLAPDCDVATELMRERVRHAHSLLDPGDPLLVLEVVRAVNLSMTRRALRSTLHESDATIWDAVAGYFIALGAVTGRTAHSGAGLDDALSHEVARAFALCVGALPDFVVRIGHILSEANLGRDYFMRVRDQIVLLKALGVFPQMEDSTLELFRETVGAGNEPSQALARRAMGSLKNEHPEHYGNLVAGWKCWDDMLSAFRGLATALDETPGRARTQLDALISTLRRVCVQSEHGDRYSHSRAFWSGLFGVNGNENGPLGKALLDLQAAMPSLPDAMVVAPGMLDGTAELAAACKTALDVLVDARRGHRLFEPQATYFEEVLVRLRDAAKRVRGGAAVHRDVVAGVLDHGLMESIVEQTLDLRELAFTVVPSEGRTSATGGAEGSRTERPTEERFAEHIESLWYRASEVPAHLQSLQELMRPTTEDSSASTPGLWDRLKRLKVEYNVLAKHRYGHDSPMLQLEEGGSATASLGFERALGLAVREILLNDLRYSDSGRGSSEWPIVVVEGNQLEIRCTVAEGHRAGLAKAVSASTIAGRPFQKPVTPNTTKPGVSHGTGLYLAQLVLALRRGEILFADGKPYKGVEEVLQLRIKWRPRE
jgi:hypothetical protein